MFLLGARQTGGVIKKRREKTMASWGGDRLRVRSSINYAEEDEQEVEDEDASCGGGEEEGRAGGRVDSSHEGFDLARQGVSGNACRQARQR